MKAVVQRVARAAVSVDDSVIATIGPGLVALVGVTHGDRPSTAAKMADKLAHLRVLADDDGTMNRSVLETGREVLVVSQFTLYGDTSRGRRPSWGAASRAEEAEPIVQALVDHLRRLDIAVATGRFRAQMQVELVNDGPVTVLLDV